VIAEKVFRVQAVVQWDDDLPIPLGSEDPDSDHPHETPPSMHLFRIAQEAMSNAIRHGGAQHIWLSGIRSGGFAALVIADDGTGFTPPSAEAVHQPRTGMGLRIMAYRAEHIGATCTLERRPEGGMQVTIRWPIPVA
jgi:signal transduction histidine kinase